MLLLFLPSVTNFRIIITSVGLLNNHAKYFVYFLVQKHIYQSWNSVLITHSALCFWSSFLELLLYRILISWIVRWFLWICICLHKYIFLISFLFLSYFPFLNQSLFLRDFTFTFQFSKLFSFYPTTFLNFKTYFPVSWTFNFLI